MFFSRPTKEIISKSLQELSANTNINQLAPGSKARFLLDTVSKEQGEQHRIFDENLAQAYIQYADGKFLDLFGDMLNLPRLPATFATAEDDNFMFYVATGTFGDINSGLDFTIPAGNEVSTTSIESTPITPGIEEQPTITYITLDDAICLANSSFVYVPVEAQVEGADSSIPANVLTTHAFTGYVQHARNYLKCTNRYAIESGEDRESHDAYRYRLANVFRARAMAVQASIRLAALSIPGVADILPVNCEQGPGTFSIYVQALTPTVSPSLLNQVLAAVNSVIAYGIRPFVLAPQTLGIEFVAAINWSPRATTTQIAQQYAAMREAVEDLLTNQLIGQELELIDVIDEMLRVAPMALSIGHKIVNQFESVYITKYSAAEEQIVRTRISGTTIDPLYNERIILETSGRHRGIEFITV